MKQQWAKASGGWPSEKPLGLIGAVALGIVVSVAAAWWHYAYRWTALQREYKWTYARTQLALFSKTSHALIYRVEGRNRRLAVNADLSDPAVVEGRAKLVRSARQTYDNVKLRAWLSAEIYGGYSPWTKLLAEAQWPGAVALLLGLAWGIPKDRERARIRRDGRRLRGPELLSAQEFNRRNRERPKGIFIASGEHSFWTALRSRLRWLFLRRETLPPVVYIPYEQEAKHFMIMGDTGAGKGATLRQLLAQIALRGDSAIVYDPALEYVPRFYRPERGDLILNPMDQRMPYWSPGDEVEDRAEAVMLAASLFPDDERGERNTFFAKGARRVFAHLLSLKPTPQELIHWLCHHEEIDRRVRGTELASMVYQGADGQRGGMLGSLAMVGEALKLLPAREEAKAAWSAREWAAREKKGWLFLSSRPPNREALAPLLSVWLDLLVVRLMSEPAAPAGRRVWFVLDELASLQKLPQLHTAVTENRKSGNPVVLAFQGRSQVEACYGREAEAMFSQPFTKLCFRTSEPHASKWISDMIGEVEIERLGESRSIGEFPQRRKTHGRQLEQRTEYLVMPSQIAGLPDLHGYLKSGNLVVPLVIDVLTDKDLPPTQEAFIPRQMKLAPPAAPEPELVFFK